MRKFSGLLTLLPLAALAQQPDMQAMAKWASADVVHYHLVGVYQGTTTVASDGFGLADIADRVVIDLTFKLSSLKLVGPATFENTKTTVTHVRDRESACLPPVMKGELEFYDLLSVEDGVGGTVRFRVRTSRPPVDIAQFCTASRRPVPAKVDERIEEFGIPSPVMLAMPLPASGGLTIAPDKKSYTVKKDGWTWTVTPSIPAH